MILSARKFLLVFLNMMVIRGDYPFRNTSLPLSERVADLVGRLTLDEIAGQMALGGHIPWSPVPAIPRLGIEAFKWNGECERGAVGVPNATAFPQGIGLAATFSPDLVERVMTAVSVEWRAYYNYVSTFNKTLFGLNCYSTTFNLLRDPRWGRNQETLGEDPYLTGHLCASYVKGVQGDNSRFLRVALGGKHFDAYSGPENVPVSRHVFDAKVTERDLRVTYVAAFKHCAAAKIAGIMCTYTSLNGVPTCANEHLLSEILREDWEYEGYAVSDAGALYGIQDYHHYTNSSVDTAAVCVKGGLNLEDAIGFKRPPYLDIVAAVKAGKLDEASVRERVKPLFSTRMKLGEFDPPEDNPYNNIPRSVIGQKSHLDLSLEAAMKSFVLLKNMNDILPIQEKFNNIAVLGPMADNIVQQFGNYHSDIDPAYCSTPLDGLRQLSEGVQYESGCNDNPCTQYNRDAVLKAIHGAEAIFLCLGTGPAVEAEGKDRTNLELPGFQKQLLLDAMLNRDQAPVILLVFNGGPLNLTIAEQSPNVAVIMDCFLPAQAGGEAVRRVLTADGPGSVPAGRSPYTWPMYMQEIPAMTNYSTAGRTYRYFKGDVMYPFGYGLSYSRFAYKDLIIPEGIIYITDLKASVTVQNLGPHDADEVVQVYISWLGYRETMPQLQLVKFERITLANGASTQYNFTITSEQLQVWRERFGWINELGAVNVYVGGQQPFQYKLAPSNVLSAEVQLWPF